VPARAARVGANRAQLALSQIEAATARANIGLDVPDRIGQSQGLVPAALEDVKRQPLSRTSPDPGQLAQLGYQPFDCFSVPGHNRVIE
jgi:hypothetical protein